MLHIRVKRATKLFEKQYILKHKYFLQSVIKFSLAIFSSYELLLQVRFWFHSNHH